ncbi:helicase C-terminal domain-containing protein [Gongronella butleri]|nr:helicase C-terminal domain-containing protein [Gongronella butleri]
MAADFGFPFEPYDIQRQFMDSLYKTISAGKIGLFESPTGTGKSLSLICGSLHWLTEDGKHAEKGISTTASTSTAVRDDGDEPDWLRNYQRDTKTKQEEQLQAQRKNELQRMIDGLRHGQVTRIDTGQQQLPRRKRAKKSGGDDDNEPDDEEFMLDDYTSDGDDDAPNTTPVNAKSNLSSEVQALMARLSEQASTKSTATTFSPDATENEELQQQKIFYASRTHSQLTQFVSEVRKTKYKEEVWTIPMGSRKNLCIHPKLRTLDNVSRINEACLDMQKEKTDKCPYLPGAKDQEQWTRFKVHALTSVKDIEDLCKMGEQLQVCPYYGARQTSGPAQLVTLPYQHLLHARTRESLGISVKDNIVIIDEAHNLMETISAMHSVGVTLQQLKLALAQLRLYLEKYASRLKGKNVIYVKQVIQIIKALVSTLEDASKKDTVFKVNEFMHQTAIDRFNLFKLEAYLETSRLAHKLHGFYAKVREQHMSAYQAALKTNSKAPRPPAIFALPTSVSTLQQITAFMMCLSNPDNHGRIMITRGTNAESENDQPQLKYILLNPADVFQPIVNDAKSVILAGGTMEPISDFIKGLFPTIPSERIHHFSCGHVIPPDHLQTLIVDKGPSGEPFVLNFSNRENAQLIDEVGRALINLSNVVPDGMVCFFSSFAYMDLVFNRWKAPDSGGIYDRLNAKKKIFVEPKEPTAVEATLRDYALHIDQPKNTRGAILFSVVNGKMSEGINFSDQLGRCVVMVGLPFPNRFSVELNEKIKYMDSQEKDKNLGQEYYENLCMRGVNQSIGRAIRHRNDYATIVLLDQRYNSANIRKKLPGWIGKHVDHCDNFGRAMTNVSRFFRDKKTPVLS